MSGTQRRRELLDMVRQASTPLSGGTLSRKTGVSRRVVAQDTVLLRAMDYPTLSIARGYVLNESRHASRLLKVCRTNEQTEDELVTIADLGETMADATVNHRIYGKVSAPLNVKSRRDIQLFANNIQTERSTPFMNVTSGYHFHHAHAEQKEILDKIEEALRRKHCLVDLLPYKMFDNK